MLLCYYVITGISVLFIEKSVMLTKKWWIVMKYLLNLQIFNAVTIFTYGLSKSNRFFFSVYKGSVQ